MDEDKRQERTDVAALAMGFASSLLLIFGLVLKMPVVAVLALIFIVLAIAWYSRTF